MSRLSPIIKGAIIAGMFLFALPALAIVYTISQGGTSLPYPNTGWQAGSILFGNGSSPLATSTDLQFNSATAQLTATNFSFGSATGTNLKVSGNTYDSNGKTLSTGPTLLVSTTTASGDYTSIVTAYAALPSTGGTIELTCGNFSVGTSGLVISKANTTIRGQGRCTNIQFNTANSNFAIINSGTTARSDMTFKDFLISQTGTAGTGTCIDFSYMSRTKFENVDCINVNIGYIASTTNTFYDAITNPTISVSGAGSYGIKLDNGANDNTFVKPRIITDSNSTGIYVNSVANSFYSADVETGALLGVDIGASGNATYFSEPYLEQNQTNLRLASGVQSVTISGGVIETATVADISDGGAKGLLLQNVRYNFNPINYYIANGVNTGIDTNNPLKLFTVGSTTRGNAIRINGNATANMAPVLSLFRNGEVEWALGAGGNSADDFVISNNPSASNYTDANLASSAKLTIQTLTGNVGIGTVNPQYRLEVNGTASTSGFFTSNATATNATTTSLFATKGNFTNLCISGDCKTSWPAPGTGTVTSVAGTWPIVSSGGNTPTISWGGLATTSNPTAGNLFYSDGTNGLVPIATTTASCSGSVACSAYTIIGSSPVTITGSGLTSYDAWTHPASGVSATTSQMIFTNASSTFTGGLNVNTSTTSQATSTTSYATNLFAQTGTIYNTGNSAAFLFNRTDGAAYTTGGGLAQSSIAFDTAFPFDIFAATRANVEAKTLNSGTKRFEIGATGDVGINTGASTAAVTLATANDNDSYINMSGTTNLTTDSAYQVIRAATNLNPTVDMTSLITGLNDNINLNGTGTNYLSGDVRLAITQLLFGGSNSDTVNQDTNYTGLAPTNGGSGTPVVTAWTAFKTGSVNASVVPGTSHGFEGGIAAGTNQFNLYMTGTADNFIKGNTTIGTSNVVYDSGTNLSVTSATGGLEVLHRNSTVITNGQTLGTIAFGGKDTQLTTQSIYANIEAQAAQNITTDAAAGNLIFRTTGRTIAGSPVEALRITADQLVGIGTSTPKWELQIATSTGAQLTLSDSSDFTSNHWSFRNAGGTFYLATSSPTTFATSTTAALSINSSGLVTTNSASTTLFFGAGLSTCNASGKALTYDGAGSFSCTSIAAGAASSTLLTDNNTFSGNNVFSNAAVNTTFSIFGTAATGVTGSTNVVLSASPTLSGTLTAPIIRGGTGVGATLILRGSANASPTAGTAGVIFQAGSSGTTESGRIDGSSGNWGIGTTSPWGKFSIMSTTDPVFVVATSSGNSIGGYDADGHLFTSGPAPAVSSCGTGSPTVTGDDQSGTIVTGTTASSCTITFSKAYKNTPVCTVSDDSATSVAYVSSISTSAATFGLSVSLTSGNIYYQCSYHR